MASTYNSAGGNNKRTLAAQKNVTWKPGAGFTTEEEDTTKKPAMVGTVTPSGQIPGTGTDAPKADDGKYKPGKNVEAARKYLDSLWNGRPGSYTSTNTEALNALLDQINNRGSFSYDAASDPMYNIYKDIYINNGLRAMQDTMGQAAALTGGYGNSYAQSVGQQQYNQYMEGLNSMVPQLQQNALGLWQAEGDDLMNRYALLNANEDRDYGRYRDNMADWMNELQLAEARYANEYNRDYQEWMNGPKAAAAAAGPTVAGYGVGDPTEKKKKSSGKSSGTTKNAAAAAAEAVSTMTADELQKTIGSVMSREGIGTKWEWNNWQNRESERNSETGKDKTYNDYVDRKLVDAYNNGRISDVEAIALGYYFGL